MRVTALRARARRGEPITAVATVFRILRIATPRQEPSAENRQRKYAGSDDAPRRR